MSASLAAPKLLRGHLQVQIAAAGMELLVQLLVLFALVHWLSRSVFSLCNLK